MRTLRIALPLLLATNLGWASFLQSSEKGTTAANFLKLGISARAISMGEAFTAVADDANALYWNPSALTRIEKHSAALNHAAYIDSSFYDYLAYGQKLGENSAFGVGINYLSAGDITETDELGNDTGSFNPNDLAVVAGYAHNINGVSVGVSAKYIQSKIIDSASTYAIDGGLLSPLIKDKFRVGVSFSNLGGQLKYETKGESLPFLIRFGSSYQILKPWLASLDVVTPKDNQPYMAVGTEYKFVRDGNFNLAGRAGYNTKTKNDVNGFTGASFGLGLGFKQFSLDYGFLPFGDIGLTHYLSFNTNF